MTLPLFAVRDWSYTYLLDGFIITTVTDVPCHLFMRWSLNQPQLHSMPVLRRGLRMHADIYFCFTAPHDNEQEEAGDTLTHTFIKHNWPYCQHRWFYFWGTIAGIVSKSTSAYLHLHFNLESKTFTGTLSNRTIRSNWGTWPLARNGSLLQIYPFHDAPNYLLRSGYGHRVSWYVFRSFLFFNTSLLPLGAQIRGAQLTIWVVGASAQDPRYPYLIIEPGHQSEPVIPNNWYNQNPETTICGKVKFSDLISGQYNPVNFTEAGFPTINPTGITKLCLIGGNDFVNVRPPTISSTAANYHSAQKGNGYQPQLTVFYSFKDPT